MADLTLEFEESRDDESEAVGMVSYIVLLDY